MRLDALRADLIAENPEVVRAASPAATVGDQTHSSRTSAEKVALFRSSLRRCLHGTSWGWIHTTGASRVRTRAQGRVRQPDRVAASACAPKESGNAIFLNPLHPQLAPLPDDQQWNHLASVHRLGRPTVERIVEDATRSGAVIGLRLPELDDETVRTPWMRSPSGMVPVIPIAGPLPARVRAVLGQRLFVEKVGLPSPVLNGIKRLAAFQNPAFYKKQSLRLSTALIPRVIACAEDLPAHIGLPRGCRTDLAALRQAHGISLDVDDQRVGGPPLAPVHWNTDADPGARGRGNPFA